jgi:hypothetical protein
LKSTTEATEHTEPKRPLFLSVLSVISVVLPDQVETNRPAGPALR